MPVTRYLVDLSAWVKYPDPEAGPRLDELTVAGSAVSCGVVELQLLSAVHDQATYTTVASLRGASIDMLTMTEADTQRALEVQSRLVEHEQFGISWIALLVAAVAERHGVPILHCHTNFDAIAEVTGQSVEWVTTAVAP
jgi:predicted nucleic acid-binding protein